MIFEGTPDRTWALLKGRTLGITFQASNIAFKEAADKGATEDELDALRWDPEKLEFLTALFEVFDDKSVRFNSIITIGFYLYFFIRISY